MIEPIAIVSSYDELLMALIMRRKSLGMSQLAVDQASGLQDGYTGKIESGRRLKNLGPLSLTLILIGLKAELALIRASSPHKSDIGAKRLEQLKFFIERARKGGRLLHARKTPEQRRRYARKLARIRWRKWREVKALKEGS